MTSNLLVRFEKNIEPIGPKDAQVHRQSLVDAMEIMINDARVEAAREHPTKKYNGYTYEIVTDGAGVKHYNLTVHFKAQGDEAIALNPLNMNDTPPNTFGKTLDNAELERRAIGAYDQRWKGF